MTLMWGLRFPFFYTLFVFAKEYRKCRHKSIYSLLIDAAVHDTKNVAYPVNEVTCNHNARE